MEYRKQVYTAAACTCVVCGNCARAQVAGTREADLRPSQAAWADMRKLLKVLPVVASTPTLQWIPKGLERRYAAARLKPLEHTLDAEAAGLSSDCIDMWSRLACAMPRLLLRGTRGELDDADENEVAAAGLSVRAELKRRLLLAESGRYADLLREAIEADQAALGRRHPRQRAAEEPLGARNLQRASIAAERGQLRTASRLLRGSQLLPPTHATKDAIAELYALDEPAGAWAPPRQICTPPVHITEKHIQDHIREARRFAHPGPSGERNSHIAALLSCPRGLPLLRRWAHAWGSSQLSSAVKAPWLHAIVVGGDKGEGKARPIVFEEMLLKLASSATVRSQLPSIRRAAGPRQFGVYHTGGAPQVAWEVNTQMAAQPGMLYIALDIRNGFGTARRQDALREASQHCPGLTGLFENLWYHGADTTVWAQTEDGWEATHIRDGLLQGACEAPIAFALALRCALDSFWEQMRCNPKMASILVRIWAYVDDLTLQVHPDNAAAVMQILSQALAQHGLHARPDKGTAYCPAAEAPGTLRSQCEGAVHGYAQYTPEGLRILGSVSDGAVATTASLGTSRRHPAHERVEAASDLARCIRSLIDADIDGKRLSPAWKLMGIVLNNALAYDCSVLPPGALAPLATVVDDAVSELLPVFAGTSLSAAHHQCARLPCDAGGLGLPTAHRRSLTAFLAQYLSIIPGICRDLCRDGLSVAETTAALHTSGLLPAAIAAERELQMAGLWLDTAGMPHSSAPGSPLDLAAVGPHSLRHRQRVWKPVLGRAEVSRITDANLRKLLDDHGGPTGGLWLNANLGPEIQTLSDPEFMTNIRARLGLPVMAPCLCQHRYAAGNTAKAGRRCLQICDAYGHHAIDCMIGGARGILHNMGCSVIYDAYRQAGMGAQREVIVPDLITPKMLEPRVDVDAWGHLGLPHERVDFTVANSIAARYHQTNPEPGHPAEVAERGKRNKYARSGGIGVVGAALETRGRHGPGLDGILRTCAGLARARSTALGREPRRLLLHWRTSLSIALARFLHVAVSSAAHNPADCGWPVRHTAADVRERG